MRAFFWSADRSGCGYYRCQLPARALAEHFGWETRAAERWAGNVRFGGKDVELFGPEWMKPDVLVGQRVCLPGPASVWLEQKSLPDRPLLVYEVDDDLWSIDPSNEQSYAFYNDERLRTARECMRAADRITVSTEYLADRAQSLAPGVPVFVVPNAVPDWLFEHEKAYNGELPMIGWAGSSTHAMDWEECDAEVRRFLRRNAVEFHAIGHNYLGYMATQHTGWVASVEEYLRTINFDIGLAPLRPHIFNRSKSPIKALEYNALGIPVIASNVGPYGGFVRPGHTGFLVNHPHEWGRILRDMIEHPTETRALARNARQYARSWAISNVVEIWRKVLTP